MRRRTQLLILLAVFLVIVAAAFLLLDFRFQQAEMAVDSSVSTYTYSFDEQTPALLNQKLDLYIEAPPGMEYELAKALREELATNPYVGDDNLRQAPPVPADDSVLVMTIDEPALFWSPFYARTEMNVTIAYASDGEVAWIDEEVVELTNKDVGDPVVRVRGEYAFAGTAYGLISAPGYTRYLAEEVAQSISHSLAHTLDTQGGSQ